MTETTPSTDVDYPRLPAGFRFGASTASYQIEGAVNEDGKGRSVWDTFTHEPDRVVDGTTGDVTCDHYHRYVEDVGLMKRLGLGGYRFSLAWARIMPDGVGNVNLAGLDFYDRLVDELLAAGVQPMATLFHWDLPQALEDKGGWLNRDTTQAFAAYADIVGARLGDRVEHWVPVNEPNVVTWVAYGTGRHAPGRELLMDALPVAHHLMLGHGLALAALRANGVTSVGCGNNHTPVWSASLGEADRAAAARYDSMWNSLFADPILLGRYPADLAPALEPVILDGDLATISAPLDFYGINYYNPTLIGAPLPEYGLPFEQLQVEGYPLTDFNWPVAPDSLRDWFRIARERYPNHPPVYITESGCAYGLGPDADGVVDDQFRIDYLDVHLRAIAGAIEDGSDVRGYYTWSLMDNFEWAEGFTKRFGLIHVDYDTLIRTPKRSFDWYAAVIEANA